jgi:hypothetical protein
MNAYAPILPMIRNWRKSPQGKNWKIGDIIVHNASMEHFSGYLNLTITHSERSLRKYPAMEKTHSYLFPVQVGVNRPVKLSAIDVEAYPGTRVDMNLMNNKNESICSNFAYPARDPVLTLSKRFASLIDIRFDSMWRKRMTRLMELDRIRSEKADWLRKKEFYPQKR